MRFPSIFCLVGLCTLQTITGAPGGISKPERMNIQLQNVEQLDDDGKIILGWEVDTAEEIIVFEIDAETTGYVGFGISSQGSMLGADIFIAGVNSDGSVYSSDRFGVGFVEPKIDEHSDWILLNATESSSGRTYLKFSRSLYTCDDEDYPITNDTNRLIWALGATDNVEYHTNAGRGSHSMNLLGAPVPDVNLDDMMKWEMTLDMVMPTEDTTYWCSFHKGPVLDKKRQIVAFDALLDNADALQYTHHFILYNCFVPPGSNQTLDEIFGNVTVDQGVYGDHCYSDSLDDPELPIPYCSEYLYVWASGGKRTLFPEDVGFPIGDGPNAGVQQYYMLEIHYDNPEKVEGLQFKSGVQFFYTNNTRPNDAGLLTLGLDVDVTLTVPPNVTDFVVTGHCSPDCSAMLPEGGITVFNSLLHSHLSGRKLKIRHFRGTEELPWLDFDDHYDFDYQQNKQLVEVRKVLQADQLTIECTYDSVWKKGEIVIGGLGTRDEMCQGILWYYPRQDIDICGSGYPLEAHFSEFGVTEFRSEMSHLLMKHYIDEPEELRGPYFDSITHKFNWTAEFIDGYAQRHRYGLQDGDCMSRKNDGFWNFPIKYPENFVEYVPEDKCAANAKLPVILHH